ELPSCACPACRAPARSLSRRSAGCRSLGPRGPTHWVRRARGRAEGDGEEISMLGHRQLSASEYLGIWRRRRKWAVVCLLLGVAGGYALSRTLPAKYTSMAVIEWTRNPRAGSGTPEPQEVSALEGQALTRERLQAVPGLVERVADHSPDRSRDSTEDP